MEILTNNHKRDTMPTSAGSAADSFRVSDIKQAVKNPNRANIFLDGKYSFSLDISQLAEFKLKIGQTITAEQLATYKHASNFGKLYQRTLEWALTRPRSIKETRDYLARRANSSFYGHPRSQAKANSAFWGNPQLRQGRSDEPRDGGREERPQKATISFSQENIDDIIEKLLKKGYLDDRKFAEYYIENRFIKKGISRKRLTLELTKKGIAKPLIDELLAQNLRTDEQEIQKIIAKKRAKYDDQKLIQYLIRQGFDYELSKNSVLETDSQNST